MLESYTGYISVFYSLIFFIVSSILLLRTRHMVSIHSKNIFWAFSAFSAMKALSILSGMSVALLMSETMFFTVVSSVSELSSEISNIFLFHFGISILTFRASFHINYKIFPILLLFVYITLNLSGVIDIHVAEKISRHGFGFSGAFLGGIGYFNIYKIKSELGEKRRLFEPLICSIALLLYAFTEGVLIGPVLDIPVELFRFVSAVLLIAIPTLVHDFVDEEKALRVGFV